MPPQLSDQPFSHLVHGLTPMSMGEALSTAGAWASMPAVASQQPLSSFTQSFSPTSNGISHSAAEAAGARHVSRKSAYGIDGQDWYIRDGVNWQQNFEAWGAGVVANGSPATAGHARAGGRGASAVGGGMASPSSMYMFQGLRGGEMDTTGFETFGSMGSLDHIPGLD